MNSGRDSRRDPLIVLRGVTCRAGAATLVSGIDLEVRRGEFIGILGPNGAGKSTLLSVMNLTARPAEGHCVLLGRDPWIESEAGRSRLRGRIGTVAQRADYQRLAPLTSAEVVAIGRLGPRGLLARLNREDHAAIEQAMERMGCAALARRAYRSLSGGEQQKVQLARALAQCPELLLLDEPTTGLDFDWQERLVALIEELNRADGLTILMTTHALGHLPAGCGRAMLLRGGRMLADGPAAETLQAGPLSALYGCAVEVAERGGRRICLGARTVES